MAKKRLNITLSNEVYKTLCRYEREFGTKSMVFEVALKRMDQELYQGRIRINNRDKIIKRKSTGIEGLDKMTEGGFPENFVIIVTGPPGTGKTTLAMQFLIEGIKNNESCIYFSFEENAEQLYKHCARFGWNIAEYIDKGNLEMFDFLMIPIDEIHNIIKKYKPSRLVFDPINVFYGFSLNKEEMRYSLMMRDLLKLIKKECITTLMVTEKNYGIWQENFDQFDFMGDGLIFMDRLVDKDNDTFVIAIKKMRGTKIDAHPKVFEIKENGIVVYPNASLFEQYSNV